MAATPPTTPPSNDVSLIIAGQKQQGWTAIKISRSVEHIPSTFELELTTRYPNTPQVEVSATSSCTVQIGTTTVITGYVDTVTREVSAQNVMIRVKGRGKCADIVDCDAITQNQQVIGANLTTLAKALCQPFGITVTALSGDGPQTLQFNVSYGETVFEILSRVAQYSGLLIYEDTSGNLVTSSVGQTAHKTGISQGVNLEKASGTQDASVLFSQYIAATLASQTLVSPSASIQSVIASSAFPSGRYRPHSVVSPLSTQDGQLLATQLATFEKARREGRAQAVMLTTDNWFDSAGVLWTPNNLIPLVLPALKLGNVTWVITEVTYTLDESGTHAHLICMPPAALTVSPSTLFAISGDTAKAISDSQKYPAPAAGTPAP